MMMKDRVQTLVTDDKGSGTKIGGVGDRILRKVRRKQETRSAG